MKTHLLVAFLGFLLPFTSYGDNFLQVRSEESRWIFEEIKTAADGWPEVAVRRTYPTQEGAQEQLIFAQKNREATLNTLSLKPQMASGVLWPTVNQWSEEWENKYAAWIEKEVTVDFFVDNNLATDCADVAYSLRWIFSRINGLPAANILGGSNVLMTNETVRSAWAKLPTNADWSKDKRFLAALNYLLGLTYTHTLWDDSFPVALNRTALKSGSYNLNLHGSSGHTQLIHWLGDENSGMPFLTLNSTVPRKVRQLTDSLLFAKFPKDKESAILRFRWAVKGSRGISLLKGSSTPGYSLEQYSLPSEDEKEFTFALFKKLGVKSSREDISEVLAKDIFELFIARIDLVNEGFEKCQKMNCKPGSEGYEAWSTPSRDSRVLGKIRTYENLPTKPGSIWKNKIVIELEGQPWPLKSVIWNWKNAVFSSDPRDSVENRWGGGFQSWRQQQFTFLQTKLSERAQHLSRSKEACKNKNCGFGSELWAKNSTDKIDRELLARVTYLKSVNSHLPLLVGDLFKISEDDHLFSLQGKSWTLSEYLLMAHQMNSNPMADFETQWGLQGGLFTISIPGSHPTKVGDHWMLGHDTISKLVDIRTGRLVPVEGLPLGSINKKPWVTVLLNGELRIFDLELNSLLPAKTTWGKKFIAIKIDSKNLVYFDGSSTQIFNLNEKTLEWDSPHSLAGQWYAVDGSVYIQQKNSGFYDLETRVLLPRDIPIEKYSLISTDDYLLFNSRSAPLLILTKASGKWFEIQLNKEVFWIGNNMSQIAFSENRKVVLYSVSKDLEFTPIETLGNFCFHERSDKIGCYIMANDSMAFFRKDANILTRLSLPPGTRAFNDSYLVKSAGSELTSLVDRKSGKVLFSSRLIILMGEHNIATLNEDYVQVFDARKPTQPYLTNLLEIKNYLSVAELDFNPRHFQIFTDFGNILIRE